jgi:peptidoglycan/xylan/chitin deacetylase (PgdA/CDA1 family)
VSAATLAIKASDYSASSGVKYNADPKATCYWPNGLCLRNFDTADFKADISACPNANDWGITYDDGPTIDKNSGKDTPALRNALNAANIKATFFSVGSNVFQFPGETLANYQSGHQIASHTWTRNCFLCRSPINQPH